MVLRQLKLDVKTLDEGAFTDGKYNDCRYKALKVTRPAHVMDVPALMERREAPPLQGRQVLHRRDDRHRPEYE